MNIVLALSPERPRHYSRWGYTLPLLVTAVFGVPSVSAQFLYRQLNLAEMTERAAVIVQGQVTAVRYEPLPGYPHVDTVLVTLRVEQSLKSSVGQTYTFREFIPPGQSRMVHKRSYLVGQQLILFLPAPSEYGLSNPLGRQQGTFHITEDSKGNKFVANETGNTQLFAGIQEAAAKAGKTLSRQPSELQSLARGPIPLDTFVSIVKELSSLPGAE